MNETLASPDSSYALLHLREGAPRDLVDETYWLLVRRLKYGVIEDVEGLRQLDRLNAAYESIVRNGVRQEAASNGHNGKSNGRWSRRRGRAYVARDPYETLFVTEDADPDIALLAAKVLAGRPPSDVVRQEWNAAVADAAATLSARWQEAQSVHGAHAPDETPAASEPAVSISEDAGVTDAGAHETAEAPVASAEPEHSTVDVDVAAPVEADSTPAPTAPDRPDDDPIDVLAASVRPQPTTTPPAPPRVPVASTSVAHTPQPSSDDAPVTPAHATEAAREAAEVAAAVAVVHGDDAPATMAHEARRRQGWMERLRGRSQDRAEVVEAENNRLLSLRDEDGGPGEHNGHRPAHESEIAAQPPLRPEPHAPVTLDLTPHEGFDFLLGDPADPAHIQIWRQARSYLLQQLSGPAASVGGVALASPIVVLEDGDEVSCGGDVVRVRFADATAPAAAESEAAPANA